MKDQSWAAFQGFLNDALTQPSQITSRALADDLALTDVTEEIVANWRRGRSHPQLAWLPAVVETLNRLRGELHHVSFSELLAIMGMIVPASDTELVDAAVRLQKLELKIEDANARATELGRTSGAASIVQAAVRSGRWSVAVWPAWEGPEDAEPIHVADRVDIMRIPTTKRALTAEEVWKDPEIKAALRSARAIRSAVTPRTSEGIVVPSSSWSILNLGSPRDALVADPWRGLPASICFGAATVDSWVNDVASIVALQIGYGLTSVRDLVMDIHGLTYGEQTTTARLQVHDRLVERPPRRRVWSFAGGLGVGPDDTAERIRRALKGNTIFVILQESRRRLEETSEKRDIPLDDLERERDDWALLESALPRDRVIPLPVEFLESRPERWRQALEQSLDTLEALEGFGKIVRSAELTRVAELAVLRYPDVAAPLNSWLENAGWSRPRGGSKSSPTVV
jgi:hypothetical protein